MNLKVRPGRFSLALTSALAMVRVSSSQVDDIKTTRVCHVLHAELCSIGPVRQRTHKAIVRTLGFCVQRTSANVDYERVAPHLYTWRPNGSCEEAYMDLWCAWAGSLSNTKIDVTIRSAFADRYKNTATVPAVAANTAASDKRRRYGPEV